MKIKVGNKLFDSAHECVMVVLTKQDKKNIANMAPDATKYCVFPDSENKQDIEKWMKTDTEEM